jgi:streptogramin lyase
MTTARFARKPLETVRTTSLAVIGSLALVAWAAGPARCVTVSLYPVPARPLDITVGPDGNLWFTQSDNTINRITTSGVITAYPIPTEAGDITTGPDGNLWYTEGARDHPENGLNQIGRITTSGVATDFPATAPASITAGPDGNVWFAAYFDAIGKITPGGVVTEYPVPANTTPSSITAGPDGNLWFTEHDGDKIGRITTSGVVTEFPIPTANPGLGTICAGPDGNLWFTEYSPGKIGKITTAGTVLAEYQAPAGATATIIPGPDGNLWFSEYVGPKIASITTGGVITEYAMAGLGRYLGGMTFGPDGNLWFALNDFVPGTQWIAKLGAAITPTGSNVALGVGDTFLNTKTSLDDAAVVDLTFSSVTIGGTTTAAASSTPTDLPTSNYSGDVGRCSKTKALGCQTDADCPSGQTCKGYHGFGFDISTTASVAGPITVCSHYADKEAKPVGGNGYVDGTGKPGLPEQSLRLLHEENGAFVDVTLPGYPDTLNNVVCGQVSNLTSAAAATGGRAVGAGAVQGAFGLYVKTDMPGGGDLTTDCRTEWAVCPAGSSGGGNVKVPKPKRGAPAPIPDSTMTCTSGNAKCKATLSGAAACNFCVQVCANVSDARLNCLPQDIKEFLLTTPTEQGVDNDSLNAGRIIERLKGLSTEPPAVISGPHGATITLNPAVSASRVCSGPINIVVPVNGVSKKVKLQATSSTGQIDSDTLTLSCPK